MARNEAVASNPLPAHYLSLMLLKSQRNVNSTPALSSPLLFGQIQPGRGWQGPGHPRWGCHRSAPAFGGGCRDVAVPDPGHPGVNPVRFGIFGMAGRGARGGTGASGDRWSPQRAARCWPRPGLALAGSARLSALDAPGSPQGTGSVSLSPRVVPRSQGRVGSPKLG